MKLWPAPLTLDELLAWVGATEAGRQVEGITLEPKQDDSIPEPAFRKMLDDVLSAPGLDSRITIILRSVGLPNQLRRLGKCSRAAFVHPLWIVPLFTTAMQEEEISGAAKRLQYLQKRAAALNAGHAISIPGFALAIRDRGLGSPSVSSAQDILRDAISAIKRASELTTAPAYHTVMPSALLLRDAPTEAAKLVATAHAASVSVVTWTVRHLPVVIIAVETYTSSRDCKQDCCAI